MRRSLVTVVMESDWKRIYALTVVYGYMYDVIGWPIFFWTSTFMTEVFSHACRSAAQSISQCGFQVPAPPLVPWEQLAAATVNLAVIGAVQFVRDRAELEKSKNTP